jgi:hypothetical protein
MVLMPNVIARLTARALPRAGRAAFAGTALVALYAAPGLAYAQASTPSEKPVAPATTPTRPVTTPPTAPRTRIELPDAERRALEAAESSPKPSAEAAASELLPTPDDARTISPEESQTRIEQIRTSNRISEVIVTPAMTGRPYIMTNREGRQSISATESSSGLSLPKFFTFEFGKPAERPAAPLPPPPSNSR